MATIKKFEEIEAWQKARKLSTEIFKISVETPLNKEFRFKEQINAAIGSVMDNIAEGFERSGNREFLQFLYIAKGSCGEFRSQLYRAIDRGYLDQGEFDELYKLAMDVTFLIQKLMNYLEQSELKGPKYKNRKN